MKICYAYSLIKRVSRMLSKQAVTAATIGIVLLNSENAMAGTPNESDVPLDFYVAPVGEVKWVVFSNYLNGGLGLLGALLEAAISSPSAEEKQQQIQSKLQESNFDPRLSIARSLSASLEGCGSKSGASETIYLTDMEYGKWSDKPQAGEYIKSAELPRATRYIEVYGYDLTIRLNLGVRTLEWGARAKIFDETGKQIDYFTEVSPWGLEGDFDFDKKIIPPNFDQQIEGAARNISRSLAAKICKKFASRPS